MHQGKEYVRHKGYLSHTSQKNARINGFGVCALCGHSGKVTKNGGLYPHKGWIRPSNKPRNSNEDD